MKLVIIANSKKRMTPNSIREMLIDLQHIALQYKLRMNLDVKELKM